MRLFPVFVLVGNNRANNSKTEDRGNCLVLRIVAALVRIGLRGPNGCEEDGGTGDGCNDPRVKRSWHGLSPYSGFSGAPSKQKQIARRCDLNLGRPQCDTQ